MSLKKPALVIKIYQRNDFWHAETPTCHRKCAGRGIDPHNALVSLYTNHPDLMPDGCACATILATKILSQHLSAGPQQSVIAFLINIEGPRFIYNPETHIPPEHFLSPDLRDER
jgi:hypothetical protein